MKELLIFRIFSLFPFIGLLLPDITNKLDLSVPVIPVEHIIVEVTLFVVILICSAGIWYAEYDQYFKPLRSQSTPRLILPAAGRRISRSFRGIHRARVKHPHHVVKGV